VFSMAALYEMLNNTKACFALRAKAVHNASPMGKGYSPPTGRSLKLLATCVLLLAACSGSDATPTSTSTTMMAPTTTTTSTTSTSTTTTTTTTTSTTTTVPDDDGPPEMDLTAEMFRDFDRWWVEANRFIGWIAAHPTDDPDVLGLVFDAEGPAYRRQVLASREKLDADVRWLDADLGGFLVVGTRSDPQEQMAQGSIVLSIESAHPEPAKVVDAVGTVIEEIPGWTSHWWRVELVRSDDGRWLIWDIVSEEE